MCARFLQCLWVHDVHLSSMLRGGWTGGLRKLAGTAAAARHKDPV